jgi:hypothetical protein
VHRGEWIDWRPQDPFPDEGEVVEVELVHGPEPILAKRDGDGWMVGASGRPLDTRGNAVKRWRRISRMA